MISVSPTVPNNISNGLHIGIEELTLKRNEIAHMLFPNLTGYPQISSCFFTEH
jgi:hypothetical protein